MKKLTVWALLATLVVAGSAFAAPRIAANATFPTGAPATTNNDDSCDIGTAPAATLLLPYFEVAESRTGETTLFTITNTSQYPAIARWTERLKQLPGWKPPYELLPGERIAPRWRVCRTRSREAERKPSRYFSRS